MSNTPAKIESFKIDHTTLLPGIYVSRIDGDAITYDMRFKKPNAGEYLSNGEMHTFEHMFATFVRSSEFSKDVLYFGPMGCQTGFYLVMRLSKELPDKASMNKAVLDVTLDILKKINAYDGPVFGASEIECGNYRTLDLSLAKKISREYLEILTGRPQSFEY